MKNGGYLTRDQILKADDLKYRELSVPEWGGVFRLRTMTAGEREQYELATGLAKDGGGAVVNLRASLVALCICDKDGGRVFANEDIEALAKKSAPAMIRVFSACTELNRFDAAAIEEAEKNSATETGGALPSD
jgi:hypothetical protein